MKWDDDDDEFVPPTPLQSPPTVWNAGSGSHIVPHPDTADTTVAPEATSFRYPVSTKFLIDLPIASIAALSARAGTVFIEARIESVRATRLPNDDALLGSVPLFKALASCGDPLLGQWLYYLMMTQPCQARQNMRSAVRSGASRNAIYDSFAVRSRTGLGMRVICMDIARYVPMQALSLAFKDAYRHLLFKDSSEHHTLTKKFAVNFASGGVAGLTSLCFVYPLDYARAHLGTDVARAGYLDTGLGNRIVKIVKQKGPLGLYKGISITAPSVFIYHATLFGIFDTLKMLRTRTGEGLSESPTDLLVSMVFAWISSSIADLLSTASIKSRERKLKQARIKDVFFKYSMSSAFRSFGAVLLLAGYDDCQHGLQFFAPRYHRF